MVSQDVDARRLVVICGPTGVGKTAIAIELAQATGGEIVAADSRTVYRHMDIGTAKPTPEQRSLIPHHLIDVADPDEVFTVARYRQHAITAIEQIFARAAVPLLVGGTGLYIRAVVDGLVIPPVAPDWALRQRLEDEERHSPGSLYRRLSGIDPIASTRIHPHNIRRLIRALEVHERTGQPITTAQRRIRPTFRTMQIGLTMERTELYDRIERRVDEQIASGLLDEVKELLARGYDRSLPSMQGLGYKEMIEHLDGGVSLAEAIRRLKRNTRRFAKRQYSWFRKDPRIQWVDIGSAVLEPVVETLLPMVE